SVGRPDYKSSSKDKALGIEITSQRRAEGTSKSDQTLRGNDKQRGASRGVEKVGLDPADVLAAEADYRNKENLKDGVVRNYPDRIYRARRPRPLLILHLLVIGEAGEDLGGQQPVVAWSISFPRTELAEDRV